MYVIENIKRRALDTLKDIAQNTPFKTIGIASHASILHKFILEAVNDKNIDLLENREHVL